MSGAQWPATFTLSVRLKPQPGETGETSAESASASQPLQFQVPIHSGPPRPAGQPRQQQPVRTALPFDPTRTLAPILRDSLQIGFVVVLPWLQPDWESQVVYVNSQYHLLGLHQQGNSMYLLRGGTRVLVAGQSRCTIEQGLQEEEVAVYAASDNATGNTVLQLAGMYRIRRLMVLAPGHNAIRRVLEYRGFVGREVDARVNLFYVMIKLERV